MFTKTTFTFFICFFIFSSCKKDIQSNSIGSAGVNDFKIQAHGTKDTTGEWYGTFRDYLSNPDQLYPDTIYENTLIQQGYAGIPYDTINVPYNPLMETSIGYQMPSDRVLRGDSVSFEAAVKNTSNIIELDLIGTQNIASISYFNDTAKVAVGNKIKSVLVSPAIDFTTFKPVRMALKNNHVFLYISGKLILSIVYSNAEDIGTIKILSVGMDMYQTKLNLPSNGSIQCDYVHLYNSYSKKLVMKEEFNIIGKSNTVFF